MAPIIYLGDHKPCSKDVTTVNGVFQDCSKPAVSHKSKHAGILVSRGWFSSGSSPSSGGSWSNWGSSSGSSSSGGSGWNSWGSGGISSGGSYPRGGYSSGGYSSGGYSSGGYSSARGGGSWSGSSSSSSDLGIAGSAGSSSNSTLSGEKDSEVSDGYIVLLVFSPVILGLSVIILGAVLCGLFKLLYPLGCIVSKFLRRFKSCQFFTFIRSKSWRKRSTSRRLGDGVIYTATIATGPPTQEPLTSYDFVSTTLQYPEAVAFPEMKSSGGQTRLAFGHGSENSFNESPESVSSNKSSSIADSDFRVL